LFKIALPVPALLAVATTVALAAPPVPTTPYPDVPANADACKVEKLEIQKKQVEYDYAKKVYDKALAAYNRGAGALGAVQQAEIALDQASIALTNARYAEAACRNDKGNAADKVCVGLALELNRLVDELAQRQEIERLTKALYDAAVEAVNSGGGSSDEVDLAEKNWKVAKLDRQQVEQKIADQRAKIAATPACKDYPVDRPMPTSVSPEPTTTTTEMSTPEPPAPTTTGIEVSTPALPASTTALLTPVSGP
jgi:hypothetical protein